MAQPVPMSPIPQPEQIYAFQSDREPARPVGLFVIDKLAGDPDWRMVVRGTFYPHPDADGDELAEARAALSDLELDDFAELYRNSTLYLVSSTAIGARR